MREKGPDCLPFYGQEEKVKEYQAQVQITKDVKTFPKAVNLYHSIGCEWNHSKFPASAITGQSHECVIENEALFGMRTLTMATRLGSIYRPFLPSFNPGL